MAAITPTPAPPRLSPQRTRLVSDAKQVTRDLERAWRRSKYRVGAESTKTWLKTVVLKHGGEFMNGVHQGRRYAVTREQGDLLYAAATGRLEIRDVGPRSRAARDTKVFRVDSSSDAALEFYIAKAKMLIDLMKEHRKKEGYYSVEPKTAQTAPIDHWRCNADAFER